MTAKYSPQKFLWATTLFFILLFVLVFLVYLYAQQASYPKLDTVSPLATGEGVPTPSKSPNVYSSQYDWKISYPESSQVDTSIDQGSASLERVTISELDPQQPDTGFHGYSVDLSVESKSTQLSTFADRDSLTQADGVRQSFNVTNLGNKTGYKVLFRGRQDYANYYLPLKDESKVLVVTTSVSGGNAEKHNQTVAQILESLELLD